MTDFERFVEFIRREAASYNEPPETPAADMWQDLKAVLEIEDAAESVTVAAADESAFQDPVRDAETLYHDPPETPHEPMWERIEAAWLLRRSAPVAAREAGLSDLDEDAPRFDLEVKEEPRRRSVALWMIGAVAASILFGFMIGRGVPSLDPGTPQIAIEAAPDVAPSDVAIDLADDASFEPLETGEEFSVAATNAAPSTRQARVAQTELPSTERTDERPNRREVVAQYATNAHLGRAETLLAAFGAGDAEPGQLSDLAESARNLLGETRLLLDMSVPRSARERALLEQIELLLAQIARLGPDAPAFERDIIAEGLDRLGTIASLRDVAPQLGT